METIKITMGTALDVWVVVVGGQFNWKQKFSEHITNDDGYSIYYKLDGLNPTRCPAGNRNTFWGSELDIKTTTPRFLLSKIDRKSIPSRITVGDIDRRNSYRRNWRIFTKYKLIFIIQGARHGSVWFSTILLINWREVVVLGEFPSLNEPLRKFPHPRH